MPRRPLSLLPLVLTGLVLSGCAGGDDGAVDVAVIGDPSAPFATGPRLPIAAQLVRSATAEGLVGFDEQGRVIPALADRWIVTDDGLSYIFRLRDGTWPDGARITGESARASLQQAIDGLRGTALALDLAAVEEIRAMAGRVIEIRLTRQKPDMLHLLAQPELGLLRRGLGAGPMELDREGRLAELTPITPEKRGLPQEKGWDDRVRKLHLRALPGQTAIDQFNSGEAEVVLGGRFEDFPRLDASSVSRGAIRLDPVAGLFGLAVVHADGFLSLPENREALAMAIDREALASAFNVGGWVFTNRVVNPGLPGDSGAVGERWPGRSLADRRATAAERVASWNASRREPAALRIALPRGPGGDILYERLTEDFGTIGLKVRRVGESAEAELRLLDSVARYARPSWFLNQLGCAAARGLCDSSADRLANQARLEPDPLKRGDLYADAEAKLTIANTYIPLGVPIRWSLVSGTTTGFANNIWNMHPLMPLALRPR
jgi:ABC-type transport system substrate-binding protein